VLRIYLVRHGDTAASGEGVLCGDLDPPLSDSGLVQAERLARVTTKLALTAIYVSPKLRAHMTAAPTAKATGLVPQVEDGLREIGYGTWEGRKESEIREREPAAYAAWGVDPAVHAPPGGESGYAIAARAIPVLERIRAAHATGSVLVVSHKATVRVMTCALLGLHVGRFRDRVACPTASITAFEVGDRGPMLVRLGDTHHLE
jgi:probable phosphoglycerate mutase